jgi:hypothetical protein
VPSPCQDTAHRTMIMACIDELRTGKTKTTENSFAQRCSLALTEAMGDVEKLDYLPVQNAHTTTHTQPYAHTTTHTHNHTHTQPYTRRVRPRVTQQSACGR